MLEFPLPISTGEWLAFLAAAGGIMVGLGLMIVPSRIMTFLGLVPSYVQPKGFSEVRGPFAGAWLGMGIACILLAQPLVYLAFGIMLATVIVGRVVSFAADGSFNAHTVMLTVIEAIMAFFAIAFPLGIIA